MRPEAGRQSPIANRLQQRLLKVERAKAHDPPGTGLQPTLAPRQANPIALLRQLAGALRP